MKPYIYPYKIASRSARDLARALQTRRVYPDRNYQPRNSHLLVNWGNSNAPAFIDRGWPGRVLNKWHNVKLAGNKLLTFQVLSEAGVSIPEYTTDEAVAQRWYLDGDDVVGRRFLQGHSGAGIVLTDPLSYPVSEGGTDVVKMREIYGTIPLYVKYVKKSKEYRVHVFNGNVIDVQQKRKRRELNNEEIDYQIRNHANGWVFCRDDISHPNHSILSESVATVHALGLDLGAVDVIWNEHYQRAYVLEVNTAPGLEGMTLDIYKNAIQGVADAV